MEENKDKNLDNFVRKSVKQAGLESPSDNFTTTLLAKIEASNQKVSITAYRPLISKVGWGALATIVVALSIFAWFGRVDTKLAWLEKMNMGALPQLDFLDKMPSLALSNIILYGLLVFGVFAVFQVLFLRQRLNSHYAKNFLQK